MRQENTHPVRVPAFHPLRDLELILGFAVGTPPHMLGGVPSWFASVEERDAYAVERASVLVAALDDQPQTGVLAVGHERPIGLI